jgi:hypothetical protein
VRSVLEVAASQEAEIPAIGTLNEGVLHAQLKDWYKRPGDRIEQVVGGFVVDLVRGDLLVEIQTGSFTPLRRKLELLTRQQRVRLVAPLPLVHRIIRLSDEGELLSARRSPRRGRVEDIFNRLVSIPSLLGHALRTRTAPHPPRRAPRPQAREGVLTARLGCGRPPARLGLAAPTHQRPGRCRPPAPAQPARTLRHSAARRGSRDRAPDRPTDDLLPESNGRPPHDRKTRQRHRPPPHRRHALSSTKKPPPRASQPGVVDGAAERALAWPRISAAVLPSRR